MKAVGIVYVIVSVLAIFTLRGPRAAFPIVLICKSELESTFVEFGTHVPVLLVDEAVLSVAPYALSCLPTMVNAIIELIWTSARHRYYLLSGLHIEGRNCMSQVW